MAKKCGQLVLFEGPDGSGKTLIATTFAAVNDAEYIHFGPMKDEKYFAAEMFRAMQSALIEGRDVVMDRCWISEIIYGTVYRNGAVRLSAGDVADLERYASWCGGIIVMCLPSFSLVKETFNSRREIEMLDSVDQLRAVYDGYCQFHSHRLPMVTHNYADSESIVRVGAALRRAKSDRVCRRNLTWFHSTVDRMKRRTGPRGGE